MAELDVVSALLPAAIQDGGRPGFMHHGVPPGGALVPEALARANLSLGNPWDAPALEIFGPLALRASGPSRISLDGLVRDLEDDDVVHVPAPRRVSYLAAEGGLDVPKVLGGRGTLQVAGLGRVLGRGDTVSIAEARVGNPLAVDVLDVDGPIHVIAGPDLEQFEEGALEALVAATFTVGISSDRLGTRLEGPALPRRGADRGISLPMVRGAIEVPASGAPIVLGPDHPTTGGYPVLAVVIRADQGRLGSLPPLAPVRFQVVEVGVARDLWREHALRFSLCIGGA